MTFIHYPSYFCCCRDYEICFLWEFIFSKFISFFIFWVTKRTLTKRCVIARNRGRSAGRIYELTPPFANCAKRPSSGGTTTSPSEIGGPAKLVIPNPLEWGKQGSNLCCFNSFILFCFNLEYRPRHFVGAGKRDGQHSRRFGAELRSQRLSDS